MPRFFFHEFSRQLGHAIKILTCFTDHDLAVLIEIGERAPKLRQQGADLRVAGRGMLETRDRRHLLGAKIRAIRGEIDLFVPA